MGKTLLILMMGFAASFGILANGKSRRFVDSVDRVVDQYSTYSARNAAASGAFMALNRLYLNTGWRDGYNSLALGNNSISVVIQDNNDDPSLGPFLIRILSTGQNADTTEFTQVIVFDGSVEDFAIWAKDSVTNVSAKDSLGNFDPSLLIENAPFMPEIDHDDLVNQAASQGHVQTDAVFEPDDEYPNSSFYYSGTTPNFTHVLGDLRVHGGRRVYGIFIVEGNATLEGSSRIDGVLYLPNSTSTILYGGGNPNEASITGGILTWGTIDGTGNHISVQHDPDYMRPFIEGYSPNNAPMRVLTWQQD